MKWLGETSFLEGNSRRMNSSLQGMRIGACGISSLPSDNPQSNSKPSYNLCSTSDCWVRLTFREGGIHHCSICPSSSHLCTDVASHLNRSKEYASLSRWRLFCRWLALRLVVFYRRLTMRHHLKRGWGARRTWQQIGLVPCFRRSHLVLLWNGKMILPT